MPTATTAKSTKKTKPAKKTNVLASSTTSTSKTSAKKTKSTATKKPLGDITASAVNSQPVKKTSKVDLKKQKAQPKKASGTGTDQSGGDPTKLSDNGGTPAKTASTKTTPPPKSGGDGHPAAAVATKERSKSPEAARRTLKVICYHRTPFKAHWSFYVPSTDNADVGRLVHATGDVRDGFTYEARDYNLGQTTRRHTVFDVGTMAANDLNQGGRFETTAHGVPCPGPSLNSATAGGTGPPRRITQRDCQWWAKEVVAKLVADGLIGAGATAAIAAVPQH